MEQKQGKRSHKYMLKKSGEILLAQRGEDVDKKKELVEQTEELMRLAHQTTFHQLNEYNGML